MEATRRPRLKVCCISSLEEAQLAVSLGAHALGLVSEMPSGPGVIAEPELVRLAGWAPPGVATFLLSSKRSVPALVAQARRVGAGVLQLVDSLEEGTHAELAEALPGISVVQVIHVTGPESVDEALRVASLPGVRALLLDSGNPALAVKQLGGTGRVHDWRLSRQIREQSRLPVYLAGGLKPENVRSAIDEVGPFGLDLCSGVRTDGRLDAHKLEALVQALAG